MKETEMTMVQKCSLCGLTRLHPEFRHWNSVEGISLHVWFRILDLFDCRQIFVVVPHGLCSYGGLSRPLSFGGPRKWYMHGDVGCYADLEPRSAKV